MLQGGREEGRDGWSKEERKGGRKELLTATGKGMVGWELKKSTMIPSDTCKYVK